MNKLVQSAQPCSTLHRKLYTENFTYVSLDCYSHFHKPGAKVFWGLQRVCEMPILYHMGLRVKSLQRFAQACEKSQQTHLSDRFATGFAKV